MSRNATDLHAITKANQDAREKQQKRRDKHDLRAAP